jgi:DNA uptake protein ComE-like DNA-binding protein
VRAQRKRRGLRRFIRASRLDRADADLGQPADNVKALRLEVNELCGYIERLEATAGRPAGRTEPSEAASRATKEKLDLNRATFEDLRQIGIPVMLSARLIAHRDLREGYHGLNELTEVPGFSAQLVSDLKTKVQV